MKKKKMTKKKMGKMKKKIAATKRMELQPLR